MSLCSHSTVLSPALLHDECLKIEHLFKSDFLQIWWRQSYLEPFFYSFYQTLSVELNWWLRQIDWTKITISSLKNQRKHSWKKENGQLLVSFKIYKWNLFNFVKNNCDHSYQRFISSSHTVSETSLVSAPTALLRQIRQMMDFWPLSVS